MFMQEKHPRLRRHGNLLLRRLSIMGVEDRLPASASFSCGGQVEKQGPGSLGDHLPRCLSLQCQGVGIVIWVFVDVRSESLCVSGLRISGESDFQGGDQWETGIEGIPSMLQGRLKNEALHQAVSARSSIVEMEQL